MWFHIAGGFNSLVYRCSSSSDQTAVQRRLSLHITVICEKVFKLSSNVFLSMYKYMQLLDTNHHTILYSPSEQNMCTFKGLSGIKSSKNFYAIIMYTLFLPFKFSLSSGSLSWDSVMVLLLPAAVSRRAVGTDAGL